MKTILITGGAGFIGSHLADVLITKGYRVRCLDSLEPQVHGGVKPDYLNPKVEYIWGNVLEGPALNKALQGVEGIFYLSASVGVGQSMYEIERYVKNNTYAASVFLQKLSELPPTQRPSKIVVASSMSIYGEGSYHCSRCGPMEGVLRTKEQLKRKQWELICPQCKEPLASVPVPETRSLNPTSVYAITKRDHEELFLAVGRAYNIPSAALRFFNIYGERQALSNPYTGVLAIFSARVLNNNAPLIFEDGRQSRDFIHVSDIVQGCILALENPAADYEAFNVGTGRPTSVLEVAEKVQQGLGRKTGIEIAGQFREGDIRNCYADITKIQKTLHFQPRLSVEEGFQHLLAWVRTQRPADTVSHATTQLREKGLTY